MPRFGVDSLDDARLILPETTAAAGQKPQFWMRYLGGRGGASAAEIAALRQDGIAVGLISATAGAARMAGTYTDGQTDANAVISAAQKLGAPSNVRLFLDIEAGWNPSASYLLGWCEAQVAGALAGAGGIYCDPCDPGMQSALAAMMAMWRYPGNAPVLWSAEPEPGAASIPPWGPATCAGLNVVLWQYAENAYGGIVDCDLADDTFTGLWEAVPVGEFSDVPSTAWYASDVAAAVKDGLMNGVGGGKFDPNGALTRAEGAALAVRILNAARGTTTPAALTALPRRFGHPTDGYGYRRGHRESVAAPVRATASLPPSLVLVPGLDKLPVLNQQQTPFCVEFSGALAHLWLQQKLGRSNPTLPSPSWGYGETHPGGTGSAGTDPASLWPILEATGWCPMADDPFPASGTQTALSAWQSVTPATLTAAKPYRIKGCTAVSPDAASIVAALGAGPVLLDASVAQSFEAPQMMSFSGVPALAAILGQSSIAGVVPASWTNGPWLGGHQFLAVGYLPRAPYLPEPLAEGVDGYYVCLTSWGNWVPGAVPLFLLPTTYSVWEAWQFTGLVAPATNVCQQLSDYLAWMVADAQVVLQRLEATFAATDAATAKARAQSAYDGQVAALKARIKSEGC